MVPWTHGYEQELRNNDHIEEKQMHTNTSEVEQSQHSRVEPAVYTHMAQLSRSFHLFGGTSQLAEEAHEQKRIQTNGRAQNNYVASASNNRWRFSFALVVKHPSVRVSARGWNCSDATSRA